MRFMVDAQLPKKLSSLLNDLGGDAIHTLDLPHKNNTEDNAIIEMADKEERFVVTKDSDFLQTHMLHSKPARLLMINTGNIANETLLNLFSRNFPLLTTLLQKHRYVEMTKDAIIAHD